VEVGKERIERRLGKNAPHRIRFHRLTVRGRPGCIAAIWCLSVISVTEVNLARVPRALEGEVRGEE
jgi:hypothetical protein